MNNDASRVRLSPSAPSATICPQNGSFGAISGNSTNGQIFILLHELGHLTGASGIAQNDGSDANINAGNNDVVWQHCSKAITGG